MHFKASFSGLRETVEKEDQRTSFAVFSVSVDGQSRPVPSQGGESLQKALFPQAFPFDVQPGISARGDASSSQHLPAHPVPRKASYYGGTAGRTAPR